MKFHIEKFEDRNKLLCFYSQQLTIALRIKKMKLRSCKN